MNSNIYDAISAIITAEGGYSNHPADKGGPTKYGITLATLNATRHREHTICDIQRLTQPEAREIYLAEYYFKPRINQLPDPLQHLVLDMAINHGPHNAITLLQDVLLRTDKNIGTLDGICGMKTITAAQCAWKDLGNDLINNLVNRRIAFYEAIVKHDPSQKEFLNGWLNRAESFRPGRVSA